MADYRNYQLEKTDIAGVRCEIYSVGCAGPVFLLGTAERDSDGEENYIAHLIEVTKKRSPDVGYRIVCYYREDWNRDFSPWEAAPVFGEDPFGGEGGSTLQWLTGECIPFLRSRFCPDDPDCLQPSFYTAGYSLAGLFALWAIYESDAFAGAVCASGSLWFPGWKEYMNGNSIRRENSQVYLSLGGKEARTKNAVMATIADAVRAQEKLLKADPHVRQTILEWNPGGHFADSTERLAKGMIWICIHTKL